MGSSRVSWVAAQFSFALVRGVGPSVRPTTASHPYLLENTNRWGSTARVYLNQVRPGDPLSRPLPGDSLGAEEIICCFLGRCPGVVRTGRYGRCSGEAMMDTPSKVEE